MKLYGRTQIKVSTLFSLALVTMSCTGEPESIKEKQTVYTDLIGEWSNVDLHLELRNESDSVVDLTLDNWAEVLGIQPILTEFRADSSYISNYYDTDGKLLMSSTGSWYVKGDSLYMIEREVPTSYLVEIEGDTVFFRGILDWDQDGVADDVYEGHQVRQ